VKLFRLLTPSFLLIFFLHEQTSFLPTAFSLFVKNRSLFLKNREERWSMMVERKKKERERMRNRRSNLIFLTKISLVPVGVGDRY